MGATGELGIDPNSDQHVKKEENGGGRESAGDSNFRGSNICIRSSIL